MTLDGIKKILLNIMPVGICKAICKSEGYHFILKVQKTKEGNWNPPNPIKLYKGIRLYNGCLLIFAHEQEYRDEMLKLQWKMDDLERRINESENIEFDKNETEEY